MKILQMTGEYVEQVANLEALCFSDPWSLRSITAELSNPLSFWLIAVSDDRVIGYIGSQSVMGESDMMNVAVDPVWRRRGVAEALINELINGLRIRNNHCLTLEVRVSNDAAVRLYNKLGFIKVGLRKNYYHNPKEDALILRKEWSL